MQWAWTILPSVVCSALQYFSILSHKRHDFRTKTLLKSKCVFWFSLQTLSQTFLILRINERNMIQNMYIGFHVTYSLLTLILLMWRIGWAPNSIPVYSYIQQDATLYSLFISGNCSTCFGWYFHPSSGAHTTVCTASGICHIVTAICRYRGRGGTGLSVLWVAYAYGRSPAEIVGSNPTGGMDICLLWVSCVVR